MSRRALTVPGLVLALMGATLIAAQLRVDGMVDSDSYFHTAFASRLVEHGFSRTFEVTAFSSWRDHFADYNLPFHLWIAPFASIGGAAGAKLGSTLLALTFVALLASFPVRHGLSWGVTWSVLTATLGWHVIFRLLPVRPHVLGMLLTFVWIEASLSRRTRWQGVIAFLAAWNHFSAPLLGVLAVVGALAGRYPGGRWDLRGLRATLVGLGLGYVVNPYVPNNLRLAYEGIVEMFAALLGGSTLPGGVFGQEFAETGTRTLLLNHGILLLALGAAVGAFVVSTRRPGARARVALAYAFVATLLGCVSARFLHELAVPLWLVAGAITTDGFVRSGPPPGDRVRRAWLGAAVAAAVLSLAALVPEVRALGTYRTQEVYKPSVRWLAERVPEGRLVFHLGTGDFNALYAFAPEHRYVAALDPMFMKRADPDAYDAWVRLLTMRDAAPVSTIQNVFGADVIFVRKARRIDTLFDEMLAAHEGVEQVYGDAYASIYRVRGAPARTPGSGQPR